MLAAIAIGVRVVCGMRLKPELSAALAPDAAEAPVQPTASSLGYLLWGYSLWGYSLGHSRVAPALHQPYS
jgi:hypothetical protein